MWECETNNHFYGSSVLKRLKFVLYVTRIYMFCNIILLLWLPYTDNYIIITYVYKLTKTYMAVWSIIIDIYVFSL